MTPFVFTTPGRTLFQWGAALDGTLAREAMALGRRPLLVCGGSLRASGALDAILDTFEALSLTATVHSGVAPEPTVDDADAAMASAAGCDCIVGIGGGSVLDVAKAAALVRLGRRTGEYLSGAAPAPQRGGLPIVAVPTTAGTGSEATIVAVFTDSADARKASFRGAALLPATVLLDASLTLSCPPEVTARSGLDAFVQAVEAYVSRGASRLTDALALEAAILTGENLLRAVRDPQSRPAREAMLLGGYMAGVALNTARLGLVHGLAHPLGAKTHAPHGLLCGILLPHVLRFNRGHDLEKSHDLAVALSAQGEDLARFAESLLAGCGAETRLSQLGVSESDLPALAIQSMESGSTKANPRPVSEADALEVLRAAL